jgi:DNA-binding NtrC family response regulator
MNKPRLLVIDDEQEIANLVKQSGESIGFQISSANSGKVLFKIPPDEVPHAIVLDLIMPDMDGIEALENLAASHSQAIIILMTGYQETYLKMADRLGSAKGLRILGTIAKPFGVDAMEKLLRQAYSEIQSM